MKCGEPKPGATFKDCDQELKHRGDHSYLGERWPRVQPTEPDWDVQELLDDTRPRDTWGVLERSFPIVVTETVTRIVWVTAESEDDALAYWGDDPTDLSMDGAEVLDGDLEFSRPDRWQRQAAFRANRFESKVGPLVPCPDCGAQAFRREWFHDPYRKCHGPIEWRQGGRGRAYREHHRTPVFDGVRAEATA